MFSSDEKAIRLAELKAKGTRGNIQRLRKSCFDAAAICEHAANLLEGAPLLKTHRRTLAGELRRGAVHLRSVAELNAPGKK